MRLAVRVKLVTLHDFLNSGTDLTETRVNAGLLDALVGRCPNSFEKRVPRVLESERERAVYDPALDVHAEIDFENIGRLQY